MKVIMFNPEIKNQPPIFPELTEKDLREVKDLKYKIEDYLGEYIHGFDAYTGSDEDKIVGQHTVFNGPITADQFEFAMALTQSPLIMESITKGVREKEFAKTLVESKIMAGMKMLDLGSGHEPTLARLCRSMGADAWTADVYPTTENYDEKLFSKEQQAVEKAHHLVMDLSEPSALQKIQEATGGDFNLATEANLAAGWMKASGFYGGKKLGMQLLKKGGVYYNGDERKATLKE
ncbi:MAG: hypothetical protein WCF77_01165 [Minisyncoccia bacterium]